MSIKRIMEETVEEVFAEVMEDMKNPKQVSSLPATLMPDFEILAEQIVNPCIQKGSEGGISYGLDPYGYSVRLGDEWARIFHRPGLRSEAISMGEFKEEHFVRFKSSEVILQPGEFILGHTLETIYMPKDCSGWVKDKSTNARCGLALQNTVLEPGWQGQITLEITNHGPVPIKLLAGRGIAQVQFMRCTPCEAPYKGKYQNQEGVVLPR